MKARFWMVGLFGLLLGLSSTGCVRIPHKDPESHFSNFSDVPPPSNGRAAIPSAYLQLADERPEDHHVMLLEVGDDALLTRIHLIRAATESIDIQTFIWKEDAVTRIIYQELLEAARRGVKVRILVDALNPITGNTRLAQMAVAHPGLEFAVFRPVSYYTEPGTINKLENLIMKMRRLNRRMHNKLLLVDDKVGIIGGRNYENKYFDRHPLMVFKDRDVVATGPTTFHMDEMFEAFWEHKDSVYLTQFKDVQSRLPIERNDAFSVLQKADADSMQEVLTLANSHKLSLARPALQMHPVERMGFFWDPPGKFKRGKNSYDNLYGEIIGKVIETANQQIIFQSPYLIYQRKSKRFFTTLREKHPDLEFIFSSNSLAAADHDIVYGVSFKDRKKLYKNMGLEIFEFKPYPEDLLYYVPGYPALSGLSPERIQHEIKSREFPLELFTHGPKLTIHAKTFVVDEKFAQIGSHNFDPRSSSLNTECGLVIEDPAFTQIVKSHILRDISGGNSWVVAKKNEKESLSSKMSGFIGAISNMLPIFDIWPYTYTSNFELRPGYSPLPNTRHPDFYKHYQDVGQFPMVEKAKEKFRAKLMKGFGGWTSPFM
ncbi:phospholipase D family protein [Kiritimatiellaeota bacterium B1221]|nr:phospholipase D family protein [Kiritimatiellaeota bacterium B1221]